ncbi:MULTISPECIES: hypothetical protein [unclassified Microcoleus]|uniref:hypothetical protein n=1 Tax=unclassified Microcoleus TaxID=2642155 RepID=UPI002FCEB06D
MARYPLLGWVNSAIGLTKFASFLSVAAGLRDKILSKIFYARSAATINMSQYEGKNPVSLQS